MNILVISHQGTVVIKLSALGSDIYSVCENQDNCFAKYFGFEARPAGPSQFCSLVL